jgi:hypothetical protein
MSVPYPVRWLTYKARIREDLKGLYADPEGKKFFSKEYLDSLATEARRLESWEIKLIIIQVTIGIFLIVSLFSANASISLFGVSLNNTAGVKEIVLALSSTISVISLVITSSKNNLLHIIEAIIELSTPKNLVDLAKLATATSFGMKTYVARQYERWVFSTFLPKLLFGLLVALGLGIFVFILIFSIVLYAMLFLDIYHRPTMGGWSAVVLVYAGITWIFGLVWLLRFVAPLPFQDKGPVRKLR